MKAQEKQDALKMVLDAARLHADSLTATLSEYGMGDSFRSARASYIHRLEYARQELAGTRFDEALKVTERVSDLELAELVALQHAVEDRIRTLVPRSPLA